MAQKFRATRFLLQGAATTSLSWVQAESVNKPGEATATPAAGASAEHSCFRRWLSVGRRGQMGGGGRQPTTDRRPSRHLGLGSLVNAAGTRH